jgi:tetratricopeptide (TPR) repeat protein
VRNVSSGAAPETRPGHSATAATGLHTVKRFEDHYGRDSSPSGLPFSSCSPPAPRSEEELGHEEAFPKAKAAATRALALDDTVGEAHTSLAFVLDLFDWKWQAAESEYRKAIDLSPNYATAHQWYTWHLIVLGRNDEAIAEMRRAESLDPLSLIISADMADVLLIARRYDQSVEQSRRTMEMDTGFAVTHYQLGQAFVQKRMFSEGIAELEKSIALSGGNKRFRSNFAYAYARSVQEQ